MDELPVGAAVNFPAQPGNVHVDQVALRIEVQIPDSLEQHGAGDHLARAPHEELEEFQLACRQLDLAAAASHPPREEIEVEIGYFQLRGICDTRAPAGECFDAGQKLD